MYRKKPMKRLQDCTYKPEFLGSHIVRNPIGWVKYLNWNERFTPAKIISRQTSRNICRLYQIDQFARFETGRVDNHSQVEPTPILMGLQKALLINFARSVFIRFSEGMWIYIICPAS